MGDRICLTFKNNKGDESPVLYAHWDGMGLINTACEFYDEFAGKIRSEPSNWMVNFITWLTTSIKDGGYYLYNKGEECCPDDNGWWVFNTDTGEYTQE